jgi:hypothetical protein
MSEIIKFPGNTLTKKAGTALVRTTLNRLHLPFQMASQCSNELRLSLRHVNDTNLHRGNLPNARFNHARMIKRAAMVDATHAALLPVIVPHLSPPVSPDTAITMLSALYGPLGKKGNDNAALLDVCVAMFAPGVDDIGEATGLWLPIAKHPFILALAVRQLINTAIFTPAPAEFRRAMHEANRTVTYLANDAERWLTLLKNSDRVLFEYDREAWYAAYANVGADIMAVLQNPEESADDEEDEPGSPRWLALEALLRAKRE